MLSPRGGKPSNGPLVTVHAPTIAAIGVLSWDEITLLDRYPAEGGYAMVNRAWWVIPVMLVLALATLLVVVGQAAAPVTLYPMF